MAFSVIIPTLQRVPETSALVADLTGSPLVGEIVVINNAGTPLSYHSPKLRELRQDANIFVNPAWNLGAEQARFEDLCFVNDDVRFDVNLLNHVRRVLRLPVGIVAPHETTFADPIAADQTPLAARRIRFTPAYKRTNGYGTLMFMRKTSFLAIPDAIKIWFGDDYLFYRQQKRNFAFRGVPIHTTMGATSGSPEFAEAARTEIDAFAAIGYGDYEHRFRRDLYVWRPLRAAAAAGRRTMRRA